MVEHRACPFLKEEDMSDQIAKQKLKIEDRDFAVEELKRFAFACGIDLVTDDDNPDKEEKAYYARIVGYVQKGWLVVNEDGTATYSLRHPTVKPFKEITFDEPNGLAYRELDKMAGDQDHRGQQAFIGALAGQPLKVMALVKSRDLRVMRDVAMLFLG